MKIKKKEINDFEIEKKVDIEKVERLTFIISKVLGVERVELTWTKFENRHERIRMFWDILSTSILVRVFRDEALVFWKVLEILKKLRSEIK